MKWDESGRLAEATPDENLLTIGQSYNQLLIFVS
jgi:hypothetical protein